MEGEAAIMQWKHTYVCWGEVQVTMVVGRSVSITQNETHSGCEYKNGRCGGVPSEETGACKCERKRICVCV